MNKKKEIRVVIDSNWWVSFVIAKYKNQLLDVLLNDNIHIYTSEKLDDEIRNTLHSPKLSKYVRPDIREEFLLYYPSAVIVITVVSVVELCRDKKDDFLLALSQDAQADYLISGDIDLLVIKEFGCTKIVKLPEFISIIQDLGK